MKEDRMRQAIGDIDDALIEGAEKQPATGHRRISLLKWSAVAAAFVLVAALGTAVLPGVLKRGDPAGAKSPSDGGNAGVIAGGYMEADETALYEKYGYSVDSGKFSSYIGGKVIPDSNIGAKLEDVTVTAGWVGPDGQPPAAKEHARAEIYEIEGVSADVAVAIRFTDPLEAALTDCCYVIMNPEADLTPVQDYVIADDPFGRPDGGGGVQE